MSQQANTGWLLNTGPNLDLYSIYDSNALPLDQSAVVKFKAKFFLCGATCP